MRVAIATKLLFNDVMAIDTDQKHTPEGAEEWEAPPTGLTEPLEPARDDIEPQTEKAGPELTPEEKDLQNQLRAIEDPYSFLQFGLNFDADKWQYTISQETVDLMLKKLLEVAEIAKTEREASEPPYRSSNPGFQIQRQIDLYENFFFGGTASFLMPSRRSYQETNLTDRAFSSIVDMIKAGDNIPPLCALLDADLLQNTQMIRPDVLMEGTKELFWLDNSQLPDGDKKTLSRLQDSLMRWIVYSEMMSGKDFQEYLDSAQQGTPTDSFTEPAKLLTLIRNFWRYSDEDVAGYDTSDQELAARKAVERISTQSTNYFIKIIAGAALRDMNRSQESAHGYDWEPRPQAPSRPQDIAPQIQGTFTDEGLSQISVKDEVESPKDTKPDTPFYYYLGSGKDKSQEYREINDNELYSWVARFSPDANREQINSGIQSFRLIMNPAVRKSLSDELGINLSTVDLETQFYLTNFLKSKPEQEIHRLSAITKQFGPDVLTCFLATGLGSESGQHILEIGENAEMEVAKEVFSKYAEIIIHIRQIKNYLEENLKPSALSHTEPRISGIEQRLLEKGAELLEKFATNPSNSDKAREELDQYKAEVLLFAATFKELKKAGEPVQLKDFQKFRVEIASGKEISGEEISRLRSMVAQNRQDRPDIIQDAEREFDEALNNPDSSFYLLRYGDNLVGFFRLDKMSETDAYLGSLNVPRHIQGSGIGDETLKTFFIQALNGRAGHATADPRNPITPLYIGRYNFVGSGVREFGQSHQPFFEMTLNPHLNSRLKWFNAPDEKIASYQGGNDYNLGQEQIVLQFDQNDVENMMQRARAILSSGQYVMSAFRKITKPDQTTKVYAVFELKPAEEKAQKRAA